MPDFIEPSLATLVDRPPKGEQSAARRRRTASPRRRSCSSHCWIGDQASELFSRSPTVRLAGLHSRRGEYQCDVTARPSWARSCPWQERPRKGQGKPMRGSATTRVDRGAHLRPWAILGS
jgi:hypothetical protein